MQSLKILFSFSFFMILDSLNVQTIYTVLLHQSVGFTIQETLNINLILTIIFFPAQFFSTFLIDYLGRRPVLLISGLLMYTTSWLILIIQLIVFFVGPNLLTKVLYVLMDCIGNIATSTGATSLRVLLVTELFPPSARTAVSQVMLFINLVLNSSLVSSFPIIYSFFPPGFFMTFVVTQFVFGIHLYRYMPETKGRAVYDIIADMDDDVASRRATLMGEHIPLIKSRAGTLTTKRNSILNISRSQTSLYNKKCIPKQIY